MKKVHPNRHKTAPAQARAAMFAEVPSHLGAHRSVTHHEHVRKLPEDARKAIERWILGKEPRSAAKILAEMAVLTIRPSTKMRGAFLRDAVQIQWLFLVEWAGRFLGAITVQKRRRKFKAVSMLSGKEPEMLRRGLSIIHRRVSPRTWQRGEIVVLEIPQLYFGALWFRAERASFDTIVPIRHNFVNLRVCRKYQRSVVERDLARSLRDSSIQLSNRHQSVLRLRWNR
jgi:hypothetical protein